MTTDERFPQIICSSCANDLTAGYVFKLKCEQSDIYLKKEILNIADPIAEKRKNVATSTEDDLLDDESNEMRMAIDSCIENTAKCKRSLRESSTENEDSDQSLEYDMPKPSVLASRTEPFVNDNAQIRHAADPNDLQYQVVSDPITGENLFNIDLGPFTKSTDIKCTDSEDGSFSVSYLYTSAQGTPYSCLKVDDVAISSINKLDYDITSYEAVEGDYEIVKDEILLNDVSGRVQSNIPASNIKNEKTIIERKKSTRPSRRKLNNRAAGGVKTKKIRRPRCPKVVSTTLTCCSCPESYEHLLDLKRHFVAKHTRGRFCLVCRKEYASMKFHANVHFKPGNIFKCPQCSEAFNSEFYLAKHCNTNHPKFVCPKCEKVLQNEETFKEHIIGHQKRPTESAASASKDFYSKRLCEMCNELFDNIIKLRAHFEEQHVDGTYCKACEQEIPKAILNHHIRDHTRYRQHKCNTCGKYLISEESLKLHNTIYHDGYEVCQYCLLELNSREEFDNHRRQHEISGTFGRFMCRICSRETANVGSLIVHMIVHDKIIKCHGCLHWFSIEKHYQMHLALGHKVKCTETCKQCRLVEDSTDP